MRKILLVLLFVLACFTMIACDKKSEQSEENEQNSNDAGGNNPGDPDCEHNKKSTIIEKITDCGTSAYFEKCNDCSYKQCLELIIFCEESDDFIEEEYLDQDGNEVEINKGTCKHCGYYICEEYTEAFKNCINTDYYKYTFSKNNKEKIYTYQEEYGTSHNAPSPDVEEEILDLTTYGACSGTLIAKTCLDCNMIASVNFDRFDNICLSAVREDIDYIDNDGNYHEGFRVKCDVCGFEYVAEEIIKYPYGNECEYFEHEILLFKIGNLTLFQDEYGEFDNSHDFEITSNKLGNNCEDGIKLNYSCRDCGKSFEAIGYDHQDTVSHIVDLSQYGVCTNTFCVYSCALCGQQERCEQITHNCYYENVNTYTQVMDGVDHLFTIKTCGLCNMVAECESYLIDNVYYEHHRFKLNGQIIFEYISKGIIYS